MGERERGVSVRERQTHTKTNSVAAVIDTQLHVHTFTLTHTLINRDTLTHLDQLAHIDTLNT